MEKKLYSDYIERISICAEDMPEEKAIGIARAQVLLDLDPKEYPANKRYGMVGRFRRRAREEGIIENN